jgi:hypothetical protein
LSALSIFAIRPFVPFMPARMSVTPGASHIAYVPIAASSQQARRHLRQRCRVNAALDPQQRTAHLSSMTPDVSRVFGNNYDLSSIANAFAGGALQGRGRAAISVSVILSL